MAYGHKQYCFHACKRIAPWQQYRTHLGLHLYQLYFIYSLTECSSGLIVYPVLCTKYLVHAYLQLCVVLKFDIHDIWCCQITRDAIIAAAARLLLHFVTHQNSNAQWILVSECSASVVSSRVPFQLQAHLDWPAGYFVMTSGCARSEECNIIIWRFGVQIFMKFRTDGGFLHLCECSVLGHVFESSL